MSVRLNNLKKGIKALRDNQTTNKSPSEWARLEEEIKDLTLRVKDIECQITKNNSAET